MSDKFIDLFAGIGGFRLGFEKQGFQCVFSSEIDAHAQEMYYEQDTEPSDAGVGISVQNEARTIVVGNEDVHNKAHYTCNVFKE